MFACACVCVRACVHTHWLVNVNVYVVHLVIKECTAFRDRRLRANICAFHAPLFVCYYPTAATHTATDTHTCTQHTNTHAHTHTHAHKHTRTDTYAHTHTHTKRICSATLLSTLSRLLTFNDGALLASGRIPPSTSGFARLSSGLPNLQVRFGPWVFGCLYVLVCVRLRVCVCACVFACVWHSRVASTAVLFAALPC